MSNLTPAEKVAAYIKLRDAKKAAEDAFKKSMERLNLGMDKLENELLQTLRDLGADSLSSAGGTVYRNTRSTTSIQDRDAFLGHVRKHGLWEALDAKANAPFVREYMQTHSEEFPGVKLTQVDTVGIRRS